jgi:hypothetical protein
MLDRWLGNPLFYLVLAAFCGLVSVSRITAGGGLSGGIGASAGFGVSAGLCVLAAAYVHVNRKK